MKKLISQLFLLLLLTAIGCEIDNINPPDLNKGLAKTKISSLTNEPYLKDILDKAGFKEAKNGRTSSSGISLNTDSILMALQADSVSYSYTFKIGGDYNSTSFTNLVFKRVVGGVKGFYIKYEPEAPLSLEPARFTGKISSYDLSWREIVSQYFRNGITTGGSFIGGRTQQCWNAELAEECPEKGKDSQATGVPLPCIGKTVVVVKIDFSGCFISDSAGATGGSNLPTQFTRWSDGTFVPSEYFNFNSRGGGPSGPSPGSTCTGGGGGAVLETGADPNSCSDVIAVYPPTDEELLDLLLNSLYKIKVDTSIVNNQKANCIYTKLGGNRVFQELINDFDKSSSSLNLTFVLGSTPPYNGLTRSAPPYKDVTIIIDKVKLEARRTVEVARTFLHEALHAKIFADLSKVGGYENLNKDNFPELFDAYVFYKTNGQKDALDRVHHEYIAKKYIDIIAAGLQQFDTRNVNNPDLNIDHYRALAWEGLTETYLWEHLMTQEQKDKIKMDRQFIVLDCLCTVISCE